MSAALCRDCAHWDQRSVSRCAECGSERLVTHPELAELSIAHIDCDAFYASVEKRDNPAIRDKPVIVGHEGGRGVVLTACYLARKFGPRSAMPMFRALEMCPHAVVVRPNMAKSKAVSNEIRAMVLQATPLVEPLSLDEAYLDLSPEARRYDRPPALLLARLQRAIERRVGVTVTVGLSYNKFLAKLGSGQHKPQGFTVIGRAEAKSFLAKLPVDAIHGVGAATARRMVEAGLTTIADLQDLPEEALVARFGKFGRRLARLVQGEDSRDVSPDRETKSVSTENTFARDLKAFEPLALELKDLAEQLAGRLQRSQLAGRTIVLKLKTGDFKNLTRQTRLSHPTRRADVIFDAGLTLLRREIGTRAYRLIGIGVADVTPDAEADPPDLF
ncbi:MAG: DNA polymerase IV, partial [Stellaceae bacterium]